MIIDIKEVYRYKSKLIPVRDALKFQVNFFKMLVHGLLELNRSGWNKKRPQCLL